MVSHILQNIIFCVQQKKQTHIGLNKCNFGLTVPLNKLVTPTEYTPTYKYYNLTYILTIKLTKVFMHFYNNN